jgi:putative DNA methylase
MPSQEIVTRRHLPHWYVPGAPHFVTFRLAGTLPQAALDALKQRKDTLLSQKPPKGLSSGQYREQVHKQLFAVYDKYLDKERTIVWLSHPPIAAQVRSSLYYLHAKKYYLLAYTILPNHVHILCQPREIIAPPAEPEQWEPGERDDCHSPLSSIMHSLKSYTAHKANTILGRQGEFWQHESYDHWVRDEDELERIVQYIDGNAVAAQLAPYPHHWFFCSAHDRYLTEGATSGWLCLNS